MFLPFVPLTEEHMLSPKHNLLSLSQRRGGLRVNKFVPSTGIGRFDAV